MNKHKKDNKNNEDAVKEENIKQSADNNESTTKNKVEGEQMSFPEANIEEILEISSKDKIDELEKIANETIEKLAVSEDKYLRLNAEFDNFIKRAQRERNDIKVNTQFDVLNSFIPVLDHFELALVAAEQSHNLEKLFEGMKLIKSEFEKALSSQSVEVIDAVGEVFDPHYHEAVAHEESEEYEKDIVCKQWRMGYKVGDRIIRPATVVISNGKKKTE